VEFAPHLVDRLVSQSRARSEGEIIERIEGELRRSVARFDESTASVNEMAQRIFDVKPSDSGQSPSGPRCILEARGLETIDRRPDGCLWIIGDKSLGSTLHEMLDGTIKFLYTPNGGKATGYRAAWFTKARDEAIREECCRILTARCTRKSKDFGPRMSAFGRDVPPISR
jgi:hypothetical protein